jgi:hypothetical protein
MKNIFYLIYRVVEISKKDDIDHAILSIIILSTFLGINFLSLWGILYKLNIINSFFASIVPIIVVMGITIIVNLIYFLNNKKYMHIKNRIDSLSYSKKKGIFIKGSIYFLISFILFLIVLII